MANLTVVASLVFILDLVTSEPKHADTLVALPVLCLCRTLPSGGMFHTRFGPKSQVPSRRKWLQLHKKTRKTPEGRSATFRVHGLGLFFFFFCNFKGSLHSSRSKVTRVTVGRDPSFRVCNVNLATRMIATKDSSMTCAKVQVPDREKIPAKGTFTRRQATGPQQGSPMVSLRLDPIGTRHTKKQMAREIACIGRLR